MGYTPDMNRFQMNHKRMVEAQNEQFSKLAMLRNQPMITAVHANEPINTALKEQACCLPRVDGKEPFELRDCNATIVGELKGHMEAMAEENYERISKAIDAVQGSFSAETSIIHDHLEAFDEHLEALERNMQTSDGILREHVSEITALRERLEEVAGSCNGIPASADVQTLIDVHGIMEQFKALQESNAALIQLKE